jgi:hypothetical protein
MVGPIERFMTEDHARVDALLRTATRPARSIDGRAFDAFRSGLIRHMALEERVLLPFAERARGGQPLPIAGRLCREHAEMTALLSALPTPARCELLVELIGRHNAIEEGPRGLYSSCDALASGHARGVLAELRAFRARYRVTTMRVGSILGGLPANDSTGATAYAPAASGPSARVK